MNQRIAGRPFLQLPGWLARYVPGFGIALPFLVAGLAYAYNLAAWLMSDDEGGYLYAAWRISLGEVPYRDFFTPQLPAFLYAGGLLFKLLGPSVLVVRTATVLATLLAAIFLYLAARRVAGTWVSLLAALAFLAHDDVYQVAREYRPEAFMLLAITAGTYLLLRAEDEPRRRSLAGSGLVFGLGVLVKLFAVLPLGGWALYQAYRALRRDISVHAAVRNGLTVGLAAAVLAGAVLAAFYAVTPQLPEAILFHHLRQGADMPLVEVMAKGAAFLLAYAVRFDRFLAIVALGIVAAFRDPRRRLPLFAFQVPTALAFLFMSRELFDRQLVYVVPALAVLFAAGLGLAGNAARRLISGLRVIPPASPAPAGPATPAATARSDPPAAAGDGDRLSGPAGLTNPAVRWTAAAVVLVASGLLAGSAFQPMLVNDRELAARVDHETLPFAAYIAGHTHPDEYVLSDYPGLNFFARRRTTYLAAGISAGAANGGQITGERLLEEMKKVPVGMVIFQDFTRVRAGQLISMRDYIPFRGYIQGAFHYAETLERTHEFHRVYLPGAPALAPLDVAFGDELRLTGYRLEEEGVPSPQVVYVILGWEAIRPTDGNDQIYLHLEDAQGHVWAIRDDLLVRGTGFQPTSAWQPGERVVWGYAVHPPTGTPPGEYTLKLGVYKAGNAARRLLPHDAQGKPAGLEYRLGTVRILPVRRDPDYLQPAEIPTRVPQRVQADGLTLLGYDVGRTDVDAGDVLGVRLFWRARRRLDADYRLRLRLPGAAADLVVPPGGGAYPTREWRSGQVVAGWYDLPTDAGASGEHPLLLNVLDAAGQPLLASDVELAQVRVNQVRREFSVPAMQHAAGADFEDGIALLGYDVSSAEAKPGGQVRLAVYWQARARPQVDYTVFVHLLDAAGQLRGQADHVPAGGARPTRDWLPGEVVRDEFILPVAPEAGPGAYQIKLGLYDPATMRRLNAGDGDNVILATVEVR